MTKALPSLAVLAAVLAFGFSCWSEGRHAREIGILDERARVADSIALADSIAFVAERARAEAAERVSAQAVRDLHRERAKAIQVLADADRNRASAIQILSDSAATVPQLRGSLADLLLSHDSVTAAFHRYIAQSDSTVAAQQVTIQRFAGALVLADSALRSERAARIADVARWKVRVPSRLERVGGLVIKALAAKEVVDIAVGLARP